MTTSLRVRERPPKLATRAVEFRAVDGAEGDGRTLEGYGAVFNSVTTIDSWYGAFEEEIAPGAFKRTLRSKKPVLQFDHGQDRRTGSIPIGAIDDIREDDHGLFVRARLFDNDLVEPIRQAIEAGAIDGMSFRFRILREEWRDAAGKVVKEDELVKLLWEPGDRGPLRRTIREVELFELGPVVFPAYTDTSVGVRALLAGLADDDRAQLLAELTAPAEPAPTPKTLAEPAPTGTSARTTPSADPAAGHSAPTGTTTTPRSSTVTTQTMSVEEREARQEEIKQRLGELDQEYAGAEMPDEARTEFDALEAEFGAHERAIRDVHERRARLARLAGKDGTRDGGSRGPEIIRQVDPFDLTAIRRQAHSVDELGQLYRDNAMRAIERGTFPGQKRSACQERVSELLDTVDDDQGTLARRILITGSPLYERAFGKAVLARSTAGLSSDEQRALSLSTDAEGGYAVPYQLDPTVILTDGGSTNPLRRISRVERIVGKEYQVITSEGVVATRTPEVAEATDADPDFEQPAVRPSAVHVFVPFSMDLDQDWARLRGELSRMFMKAKDNEEADSFINGAGTLISGGGHNPQGIVAGLPAGAPTDTPTPGSEVDDGGVFSSQTLYDMEAGPEGLPPDFRANARWLANKSIYNLVRQLDTQGGADLWVRLGAGQPGELIGYPAEEASRMPATTDDRYLILGDFQEFLIVDRVGMSVELVPHVFGASRRMPTGQRGLYARWRNSTRILVPNAFRVAVAGS